MNATSYAASENSAIDSMQVWFFFLSLDRTKTYLHVFVRVCLNSIKKLTCIVWKIYLLNSENYIVFSVRNIKKKIVNRNVSVRDNENETN